MSCILNYSYFMIYNLVNNFDFMRICQNKENEKCEILGEKKIQNTK